MGNIGEQIKKVLANKNTMTILLVLVGVVALYAVYNSKVKDAISLVKVPYAKAEITSRTKVSSDMIGYVQIQNSILKKYKNIVKSSSDIIDHYINYGSTIPENSFFYSDVLLAKNVTPSSEIDSIKDGYTVFTLGVTFDSTYGNSIYPGNYIDLYVEGSVNGKILFGRLIKAIEVMGVFDADGNSVFESSSEQRTPKYMFFAVPDNIYKLLNTAEAIGLTIYPIPRNATYSSDTDTPTIDSQYINNYILSKSASISN